MCRSPSNAEALPPCLLCALEGGRQIAAAFEKRLAALAERSSKEATQSLAKWVCFNRKKGPALAAVLARAIADAPTPSRKIQTLAVAHEVLLAESDLSPSANGAKWEKNADLRSVLGESVVVAAAESVRECDGATEADLDAVRAMADKWKQVEAFGGPTIVDAVLKALVAPRREIDAAAGGNPPAQQPPEQQQGDQKPQSSVNDAEQAAGRASDSASATAKIGLAPGAGETKTGVAGSPVDSTSSTAVDKKPESADKIRAGGAPDQKKRAPAVPAAPAFDFEAEGVPYEKLDPRTLLNSCRSIASMQISRDLRNDSCHQTSSILSGLRSEVADACRKALADAEGDAAKARGLMDLDSLPAIGDDILDIKIGEALKNVRRYREIIIRQKGARKALIDNMIKSWCRFGSTEAAEAYYSIAKKEEKLERRKRLLSDAMELEGLDVLEDDGGGQGGGREGVEGAVELEPLTWYKSTKIDAEAGAGVGKKVAEPTAKKARIQ